MKNIKQLYIALHLLPFGECEELSSKTWNNDDVQEFLQQSRLIDIQWIAL